MFKRASTIVLVNILSLSCENHPEWWAATKNSPVRNFSSVWIFEGAQTVWAK
jgi:hypothetical protein